LHLGHVPPLPGPATPELALDSPAARALATAHVANIARRIDNQRIVQIPAVPADHSNAETLLAQMVRAASGLGATGLLLEGFGAGNLPVGAGALAAALRNVQVPILIASRAIAGQVGQFDYAAGAWIADTGAIPLGDMTPVAALAKLAVLASAAPDYDWDDSKLRALMRRNLAGECHDKDRFTQPLWPGQSLQAADGDTQLVNDPDTGPQLMVDGQLKWQAPSPGRLQMQGDRLTLIAPNGMTTWNSPIAPGTIPVLTANPPALQLIDPTRRNAPVIAIAP